MPARRKLPPNQTLLSWVEEGLTHQEIAERSEQVTGESITRGAVTQALARLGVPQSIPRYSREIPWRVHTAHASETAIRMLRMLGRRHNKNSDGVRPLTEDEGRILDEWLAWLRDNDAVVAYCPVYQSGRRGFYYVPRDEVADGPWSLPVRTRPVEPDELPEDLLV